MSIIITGTDSGPGVRRMLPANEQLVITTTGVVASEDNNAIEGLLGGVEIFLSGLIYAQQNGIVLEDDDEFNNSRVSINATGVINAGLDGIVSTQGGNQVSNSGLISAVTSAIDHSNGDNFTLINHGTLTSFSTDTVSVGSSNGVVINHGTIGGVGLNNDAVDLFVSGDGLGTAPELYNYGTISSAGGRAISGDSNDPNRFFNFGDIVGQVEFGNDGDFFRNGGSITGNVILDDGNDTYDGRSGTVDGEIRGGAGDDTYIVSDSLAPIVELMGEGTDTVRSLADFMLGDNIENLLLIGGADLDGFGNALSNNVIGNTGNNLLEGGDASDTVNGGGGDDVVFGGSGTDIVRGQNGNDIVSGDAQNDEVYGGEGNDTLSGGGGNDLLNGGTGADVANGDAGSDTINGGDGDDILVGGGGNDSLNGQDDNDILFGGLGSDDLFGGNGADTLDGGNAADRLDGGRDDDVLIGGLDANRDTFVFGNSDDRDLVQQFQQGLDELELDDLLWGGGLTEAQVVSTFADLDASGNIVFDFGGGDVLTVEAASAIGTLNLGTISSDLVLV